MVLGPWVSLFAYLTATSTDEVSARYDGVSELQLNVDTVEELASLVEGPVEILNDHLRPGPVLLLAETQGKAFLESRGHQYHVLVDDVQLAWEDIRARNQRAGNVSSDDRFLDFKRLEQVHTYMDELVAVAPDRARIVEIGTSLEGRSIRGIQIGHPTDDNNPQFLIIGAQHAREWLSPMGMMYFADQLIREYENDENVRYIVDHLDTIIVPVYNPDGYIYSWDQDRFWRKNRRGGHGVDLNRNWGAGWGIGNSGASPTSQIYPGPEAFSEPETQALRDFVLANERVVAFIDYHTPINSVLYPYGHTTQPPDEIDKLKGWAEEAAQVITQTHGVKHTVFRPSGQGDPTGMGPQGGLSIDWFTAEAGALAWIVEMRGPDFDISADQIIPGAEENFAGFQLLANKVIDTHGNDDPGDEDEDEEDDDDDESDDSSSSDDSSENDSSSTEDSDKEDDDDTSNESDTQETSPDNENTSEDESEDSSKEDEGKESDSTESDSPSDDESPNLADDDESQVGGGCHVPTGTRMGWLAAGLLLLIPRRRRNA